MAQEEKKDEAEAKRAPRGGITRRGLFIGVGSTAALLGSGRFALRGPQPAEPTARRHRRGPSGERLHPLRALLRGVPP